MRRNLMVNYFDSLFSHYKVLLRAVVFKRFRKACKLSKKLRKLKFIRESKIKYQCFDFQKIRTYERTFIRKRKKLSRLYFMQRIMNTWMVSFNKRKEEEMRYNMSLKFYITTLITKSFVAIADNSKKINNINTYSSKKISDVENIVIIYNIN